MNLLELQRRMSQDVTRPLTDDFAMQATTEQGLPSAEVAAGYIKPNSLLTSFERLEIYNRQYWFRVIAAVSEDFPALNVVLGPEKFDSLVLAYLRENPSTSFSLRNLGARLPAWLASYPDLGGSQHALAVDVARLEWAYIEAFDGASVVPLGWADFADLGTDSTLRLQPHLQLLDLQYPVDELVLAVRKLTPEIDIVSNAVSARRQTSDVALPEVTRSSVYLAVHRFEDSVYYRRIDREEFLLLADLRDGDSIATAIGRAFEGSKLALELQAAKVQDYFAHAAELGWFCSPKPAQASDCTPLPVSTRSTEGRL
jgi:Putative DNA-binding domain